MHNSDINIGFLFDLDGVLIDSEKEYSKIWAQINNEFPTGIENLEEIIKGCTLPKILNDYFPGQTLRIEVAKRLHELERKMHYEYLPHADEFLKNSKQRGIACALVTSSDQKKMQHLNEELPQIFDHFNYIVTSEQVKASKPSPEGYLLGAQKINKSPKNCVVFEDSLQGVMAGKNAGAFVVGVVGTMTADKLAPYSDLLITNLGEIDIDPLITEVSKI